MENIYINEEYYKSGQSTASVFETVPRSSERRLHGAVVLSLGLLTAFLLAGLIGLCVCYRISVHGAIKANLTECPQATEDKLPSVTKDRNQPKPNATKKNEEMLFKHAKSCPAQWKHFNGSCYFLSKNSTSWTNGRRDCRNRGADLVIINSAEEQTFISGLTKKQTWIGLSDIDQEGSWKWVDGSPLTVKFWAISQPDNGLGDPKWGEEDCAYSYKTDSAKWNDRLCGIHFQWMCEKTAN